MKTDVRELGSEQVLGVDIDGSLAAKFIGTDAAMHARLFLDAKTAMAASSPPFPEWLLDLLRAFGRKVVPLDITEEGTYEEATTRWGMNPIYEAVPAEIRAVAEATAGQDAHDYWSRLRSGWDGRGAPKATP